MMNKKLVLCSFLTLFQSVISVQAGAVDFIRTEDEDILWDTETSGSQTLKGNLTDMTNQERDQYGRVIVRVQQQEPSLGIPVQAIPVPDEINSQAPLYDNPELVKTYYNVPSTVSYAGEPIGEPRRESLRKPEDFDLMMRGYSPQVISSHRARLAYYKEAIHNCMNNKKHELGIEIGMLDDGNLYDNTAYLTQTMEEIEQCYDNIGLDIIDEFYAHDSEVLRDYNRHSAEFHVNGTDAAFDTKYCGETCSVKALAESQMDKFADFRIYLYKLLHKAPIASGATACDANAASREYEMNEPVRQPMRQVQRPVQAQNPQMRPAPKAIRVRTPEGELKYVRLNSNGEYELMDNETSAKQARRAPKNNEFRPLNGGGSVEVAPIRLDYDGVPLIDEDDL